MSRALVAASSLFAVSKSKLRRMPRCLIRTDHSLTSNSVHDESMSDFQTDLSNSPHGFSENAVVIVFRNEDCWPLLGHFLCLGQ
jgi:hypothetical protein